MTRGLRLACLAAAISALSIQAQSVISARSGTIHYVEGKVLLNGQEISPKFGEFPAMENGSILKTTEVGRVEVLLSPGVVLRVGESSSIRMVANSLTDTQVELQSGKAVLECADILKGNGTALLVDGHAVSFAKDGIYEATTQPAAIRVYKGEATVADGEKSMVVHKGHEALLSQEVTAQRFDADATDDLYNWSSRRSGYLALANIAAAREVGDSYSGYGAGYGGFYGGGYASYLPGMWAWNPWFGMFTMVPMGGMFYSPFGWGYYSPFDVGGLYASCYYYGCYYPYGTYAPSRTVAYGPSRGITRSSSIPLTSPGLLARGGAARSGADGGRGVFSTGSGSSIGGLQSTGGSVSSVGGGIGRAGGGSRPGH